MKGKVRWTKVMLLSALLVITALFAGTGVAYADEDIQLDRICFDGDSMYDWTHFYYIDSLNDAYRDLNITVLDEEGQVVSPELYELSIFHTWYDEAAGESRLEEVKSPYGLAASDKNQESGFTEYLVAAVLKDNPNVRVEATCYIMDCHSLNWICAEINFPGYLKKEGWRMCDRFFIDLSALSAPVVMAEGTTLTEGKDYKVTYYTRSGDLDSMETDRDKVLEGVEKLSGIPTKAGEYVVYIDGIDEYYGQAIVLLDVKGETGFHDPEDPAVKKTGWYKEGKNWFYGDSDGNKLTGWKKISGKWYYFDKEGRMITGWKKLSGKWYYFSGSGIMQTGWKKISGKWYFFKSNGNMAAAEYCKGYWLNKDGTWTYKAKASWKKSSKGWWYGDTKGWYAKNTKLIIDGKEYSFNAAGYLVQ